jgi:hypothetical protein
MGAEERHAAARNLLTALTAYVRSETINKLTDALVFQNPSVAIGMIDKAGRETGNKHLADLSKNLKVLFGMKQNFPNAVGAIS